RGGRLARPLPTHLLPFITLGAATVSSALSLHDALPICPITAAATAPDQEAPRRTATAASTPTSRRTAAAYGTMVWSGTDPCNGTDRKSTRLNSSHVKISYAVFCLKKKNEREDTSAVAAA